MNWIQIILAIIITGIILASLASWMVLLIWWIKDLFK